MPTTSQKLSYPILLALSALFTSQTVMAEEANSTANSASESTIEEQFLSGLNEREAGDYEASISAFQGILSSEPTLNRARAELAVSYFRSLNFAAARE